MEKGFVYTLNLAAGYQKKAVVDGVELELNKGEITVIIGPNGGGKSTVLKTVTGQLAAVCGDVFIGGENIKKLSGAAIAEKMSMVMTERIQSELMTCEDVAAMGRYPYTGRLGILGAEDRKKVEEAMDMVNVTELRERHFDELSDGQRQRVLLARAVCQEPELIVLDEPTSFLDIKHKLDIMDILKKLAKEKHMAVLMSLHELVLAEKIADRVMCIKDGRADRYGRPEEIFKDSYMEELYGMEKGSIKAYFGGIFDI